MSSGMSCRRSLRGGWLEDQENLVGYGDGGLKHFLRKSLEKLVKCKASTPNLLRDTRAYDVEKEVRYELDVLLPSILDKAFKGEL